MNDSKRREAAEAIAALVFNNIDPGGRLCGDHFSDWKKEELVDHWSQLGFVVAKKSAGKISYVEEERSPAIETAPGPPL